jgi:uncharacterized membrane protein
MDEKQPEQHHELSTRRIEALSDGIFAFAMTLLVLDLQFPDAAASSGVPLATLLFGQTPRFFNFFLSFTLLAVFWVIHNQQFHHIKRTDKPHLWINIGLLAFIVLIPFSASLEGDFEGQMLSELVFAANMFMVGVFFLINWAYAVVGRRFTDQALEEKFINDSLTHCMITPGVSLLAMVVAFFAPQHSSECFLLIPVILIGLGFRSHQKEVR